jgi:predicted metal-dependent hydrolase
MGDISLDISGEAVPVLVRVNARARRLILKVDPLTGHVVLVVPNKRSTKDALAFAERQHQWIAAQRAGFKAPIPLTDGTEIPLRDEPHRIVHEPGTRRGVWTDEIARTIHVSGQIEHAPRRVTDWLKREAKSDLWERVGHHTGVLDLSVRKISVRDTRSRWGSCSSTGALSFSWRLILTPPDMLDYVAAHEVAHLIHHDHSPAFWAVVDQLTPHKDKASYWLKKYGMDLHRYG